MALNSREQKYYSTLHVPAFEAFSGIGEIAKQLGISLTRVKQHLTEAFQALGAANRAEAVVLALRKDLLKI